ncbi:MAG TPA: hypothetical protein VF944_04510 [Candidatus Bathyarchaeia archaeon]
MTPEQRAELHHILDWTREPVTRPIDYMTKLAVKCFLNGQDARAFLLNKGIEAFIVKRAIEKAIVFLGNERLKRKTPARKAEILAARARKSPTFTSENFRVTMDYSQDRNYGMANVSIYCIVEVWESPDDVDVEKEYLVNFSDFTTKEWLTRLMVWALMNKREILIKPATELEMSSMRMFVPKDKVGVE